MESRCWWILRTCSNRARLSISSLIALKTVNSIPLVFKREKELAAVKINAAEVDIIASELELDKKIVETTLREHEGDAVAAVRHLLC
ncbi:huntingtin-interacting protein K-like [Cucurbita pepo subsp. pepo]|uniref:huntingtin-interacting protein K-like n=1 Tax=Cucurbita pepo subsp. pepo TaxID=3664 RepID=UPI000C9D302D|nr:huntingtin-interacting protein K-like [Cucurbita pepo subsp. pepo]